MNSENVMDKFDADVKKIATLYSITKEQAACYLCNFEDRFICHEHGGGCKNIEQCRNIRIANEVL